MRKVVKSKTRGPDLSKLKKLLGPPPVLSSESLDDYNAVFSRLMEAMKPEDFVLAMLVADLADSTWEMRRYKRHKVLLAESKRIEKERRAAKYAAQAVI